MTKVSPLLLKETCFNVQLLEGAPANLIPLVQSALENTPQQNWSVTITHTPTPDHDLETLFTRQKKEKERTQATVLAKLQAEKLTELLPPFEIIDIT